MRPNQEEVRVARVAAVLRARNRINAPSGRGEGAKKRRAVKERVEKRKDISSIGIVKIIVLENS
jgi:hypothetical protein